jgi:hypothetical protein
MKAVLALILIYGDVFGCNSGRIQHVGRASHGGLASSAIDPAKRRTFVPCWSWWRSRHHSGISSTATGQYRQKFVEASANNDRAQAFRNAYLAEFQKKFDADAVTGQLVGIYDKHFTDDEIRGCGFTVPRLGRKSPPKCPRSTAKHKPPRAPQSVKHALRQDLRAEYPTRATFAETVHAVAVVGSTQRSLSKRSKCSPTLSNLKLCECNVGRKFLQLPRIYRNAS